MQLLLLSLETSFWKVILSPARRLRARLPLCEAADATWPDAGSGPAPGTMPRHRAGLGRHRRLGGTQPVTSTLIREPEALPLTLDLTSEPLSRFFLFPYFREILRRFVPVRPSRAHLLPRLTSGHVHRCLAGKSFKTLAQ